VQEPEKEEEKDPETPLLSFDNTILQPSEEEYLLEEYKQLESDFVPFFKTDFPKIILTQKQTKTPRKSTRTTNQDSSEDNNGTSNTKKSKTQINGTKEEEKEEVVDEIELNHKTKKTRTPKKSSTPKKTGKNTNNVDAVPQKNTPIRKRRIRSDAGEDEAPSEEFQNGV